MASDTGLRGEIAGLTEAVRELRDREVADEIHALKDEIAALREQQGTPARTGHHGCHCGCWHYHYTPTWYHHTFTQPVWTGGSLTVGTTTSAVNPGVYYGSSGGAGGNTTYTVSAGN